jgi:hypothetical protein
MKVLPILTALFIYSSLLFSQTDRKRVILLRNQIHEIKRYEYSSGNDSISPTTTLSYLDDSARVLSKIVVCYNPLENENDTSQTKYDYTSLKGLESKIISIKKGIIDTTHVFWPGQDTTGSYKFNNKEIHIQKGKSEIITIYSGDKLFLTVICKKQGKKRYHNRWYYSYGFNEKSRERFDDYGNLIKLTYISKRNKHSLIKHRSKKLYKHFYDDRRLLIKTDIYKKNFINKLSVSHVEYNYR